MTIEEMKKRKKALGLTSEMIAEKSGVSLSTVQKIFAGAVKTPRRDTRMRIERVLRQTEADNYFYSRRDYDTPRVRESNISEMYGKVHEISEAIDSYNDYTSNISAILGEPGPYTIEDYYRYTTDRRAELINGYLYDMAAPTTEHQIITSLIYQVLFEYSAASDFACRAYQSPVDVKLSQDDKNMLQPDVFMICHNDAHDVKKYIEGAPDFVVEVMSPSTLNNDMENKKVQYLKYGVREYWIVDSKLRSIYVYCFESGWGINNYSFDDIVPVNISDGKLSVDFKRISSIIKRMQK